MHFKNPCAALAIATLLLAPPAHADEGHDHGDAAPALAGEALPRFTAESETFELVGVLNGKQITLYLDRFADNSPVHDGVIELEISGARFKADQHGEDGYEVMLTDVPKPGVLAVTATVSVGNEADLLVGELDIHGQAHAEEAADALSWPGQAAWAGVGLGSLALLVWGVRRSMAARRVGAGGAA